MITPERTSQHIDFNEWLANCPVQWFLLDSDYEQRSYQFIVEDEEEES